MSVRRVRRRNFAAAALAFAVAPLAGCDNLSNTQTFYVLEVRCGDTGFDADKKCLDFARVGAELEVSVNTLTQKVQISITKNDRTWFVKDFILDNCSVVDARNWRCLKNVGNSSPPIAEEYGMVRGQFYRSVSGSPTPESDISSLSGPKYWAWHYGLISLPAALAFDGYSETVVRARLNAPQPEGSSLNTHLASDDARQHAPAGRAELAAHVTQFWRRRTNSWRR
jgi:hypothetical protein